MIIYPLEYYQSQAAWILKKTKIVSSIIFDDEYKILKTESRIMVKSLKI